MGEYQNNIYRFIVSSLVSDDPRSISLLANARSLGFFSIDKIECQDLYFIEGLLNPLECRRLAEDLLSDPVTQQVQWQEIKPETVTPTGSPAAGIVEVALRPGVTDPVAAEIVRAAHEIGIEGLKRASSGFRYLIKNKSGSDQETHELARRLLTNPVIHRYSLGAIDPVFPQEAEVNDFTEMLPVRRMSPQQLLDLSVERRAALDLNEMLAIQAYCKQEDRDLSDIEFEMIAQTWSEHCVHKTFKAQVDIQSHLVDPLVTQHYPGLKVNNVMKTYLKAATDRINAPWVRSAFVDNAGILDLDGKNEVSFKVETHNHPSAIEPFGGANTGVGGVIRDVIGVSAKPIAVTDILCFGPQDQAIDQLPEGVLHPQRIMSGVVAGVQDYGNKIGIPTVNGAVLFDPGFTSNPLVFCGCVGIAPQNKHPRSPQAGDRVIVIGGRTGRDGLRGATFSSMTMDAQTGEVSGASVQIGVPITEKGLIDVTLIARDEGLYNAITDCGAGGLSSAVGEMASTCGGEIDLSSVKLKYSGLSPWEVWLSEAQERMVMAVSPANLPRLQEICDTYSVELTDIGAFNTSGRLLVRFAQKVILNLDNQFLHEGIPQRKLTAVIPPPAQSPAKTAEAPAGVNFNNTLLKLLAHPNIASKEAIIRIYDHEIQGATVVKPLTGAQNDGPSDACVLKPADSIDCCGIALSNGINTEYGKLDAYGMAVAVIDEAVRNVVAVGANPDKIAILDNFCWGDPTRPETMGSLLEAARGCYDGALRYKTPFVSGKDSFNNEYLGSDGLRHAIPPTLLISALGLLDDIRYCISMDAKTAGNLLYLVGEMNPAFGGSHFNLVAADQAVQDYIPQPSLKAPQVYKRFYQAVRQRLVRACHDLSEGGLAVAAAEMGMAGRLGIELDIPAGDAARFVFGETNGCLLVEIEPRVQPQFEKLFEDLPVLKIGRVTAQPVLNITRQGKNLVSCTLDQLLTAWQAK